LKVKFMPACALPWKTISVAASTAVLDGTRNVVQLYGDERLFEVRLGFSHRLHRRLEENMPGNRRCFLGGMVAAAAAVLVAGRFEVAGSSVSRRAELRSEFAQPGAGVPPDMWVIVSGVGKLFTQLGVPSSTTKPVFRQSTPGNAATGIRPLRPLHEKVSDRLISACADSNRQASAREDQCIKSRRGYSELEPTESLKVVGDIACTSYPELEREERRQGASSASCWRLSSC
jgi:hypothetical protein